MRSIDISIQYFKLKMKSLRAKYLITLQEIEMILIERNDRIISIVNQLLISYFVFFFFHKLQIKMNALRENKNKNGFLFFSSFQSLINKLHRLIFYDRASHNIFQFFLFLFFRICLLLRNETKRK